MFSQMREIDPSRDTTSGHAAAGAGLGALALAWSNKNNVRHILHCSSQSEEWRMRGSALLQKGAVNAERSCET
jgi:hypothetical protein